MKLFKDLLKVNDPEKEGGERFSQSRVYLFLSVITILFMSGSSIFFDVDNKNFQYALDTVFWLGIFFGSYALIGKGMKYQHLQTLVKVKDKAKSVIDREDSEQ